MRKVYHRAVVIPLNDVEQLWREYDQFENKINKMTVRRVSTIRIRALTEHGRNPRYPFPFPLPCWRCECFVCG